MKKTTVPEIKVERFWSMDKVRTVCINWNLYTCGDCKAYSHMLFDLVANLDPTPENIYIVAKDITEHSDDQTISNVMYLLERDAVETFYDLGEDS